MKSENSSEGGRGCAGENPQREKVGSRVNLVTIYTCETVKESSLKTMKLRVL